MTACSADRAETSRDSRGTASAPLRILAIAPQPFYTPRGTPLSVYYRTLVLSEIGEVERIDLLTYGQGEDVDIPNVRIVRIPRFGFRHVKIGPSVAKLFLDVVMVLYTIGLLVRYRHDVVHAHEESVFWCRFLKPIFRFKLVYDMHSSLPQQLTNFRFTTSKLLIGTFDQLERTCLRSADAVITICPDLATYALAHGVEPVHHVLIENSIFDNVRLRNGAHRANGTTPAQALNGRGTLHTYPTNPAKRIVYAGTFESYQGIDLLLRAFSRVAKRDRNVELLLVGGHPAQVEQMVNLSVELGISSQCCFTGQLPKSEAMQYVRSASVLVSPRREGTNTPLKLYELLASGIPLVATRIWSHTQVLTDDVCILVELEPESMAEGLLAALSDHARCARNVRAAKRLYERNYSRSAYEAKVDTLLTRLRTPAGAAR